MAIRERSSEQADFKFPKVIPPERALAVQTTTKTKPKNKPPGQVAVPKATQTADAIVISPSPKHEVDSRVIDERSAFAVGATVEVGCWEKDRGFTLARAKVGGAHLSRRRTVILVAVGITLLGASTSTYWRPHVVRAIEAGRSWLFSASPTPPQPKAAAPRTVQKRYQCWFFGWHPCK